MKSPLAVVMLLSMLIPLACSQSRSFAQIDLFQEGDNGVKSYRIPALVQTNYGTIIAVVDARQDSSRDLPARISLVMRRSFDGGKTWRPMRTLLAVPTGGVGDPALLLDRSNGRVWCFHTYGPPGIGFSTAKPGARTGPATLQVHAMYSDDDGKTWSKDIDLTPQIKDPSWQAMFAASGTDIQLKSGRLLVPLVIRDGKGAMHDANAYSDDHGKTWRVGKLIGDGTDESHNVELSNGVVLQNMRTHNNKRAIARSTDGGITFGSVRYDSALVDPNCNAGITSYIKGKYQLLVFTNDASTRREDLTVKVSYDEGHTWPEQRVINPGPSGYSTVVQLKDGSLGVLYERGEKDFDEKISFAHFNLSWIAHRSR